MDAMWKGDVEGCGSEVLTVYESRRSGVGAVSALRHPIDIIASFEKIQHSSPKVLSRGILLPFFVEIRGWRSLERRPFDRQRVGARGCSRIGNVGDLPA